MLVEGYGKYSISGSRTEQAPVSLDFGRGFSKSAKVHPRYSFVGDFAFRGTIVDDQSFKSE
jgi:hypothetical protein